MPTAARRRSVPSNDAWGSRISATVRFVLAVGLAGMISGAVLLRPHKLVAHTDVVGSTTFTNFDVDYYFNAFYLGVIAFPVLALGFFLLITWVARRLGLAPPAASPPASSIAAVDESKSVAKTYLGMALRVAATGAILGLEAAIAWGSRPGGVWPLVTVGALGYGVVVLALAGGWRIYRRSRRPWATLAGATNALLSPLVIVGLLPVSAATHLTVLSTGAVHQYAWLPLWLAVAVGLGAVVAVGAALGRLRSDDDIARTERVTLLLILGAVGMFLVLATLPGELGQMDMFHEGEGLVAARLASLGYFPWRDIIWGHGLLEDAYRSQFGMLMFDNSRWGAAAGFTLILWPLYLVLLYLLFVYLFRHSWPFLLVAVLFLFSPYFGPGMFRFLLWPLVLLLLAATLNKPAPGRIVALVVAVGIQAIITPESAYAVPACGAVIVGYELYHFDRKRGFVASFQRTIVGGIAAIAFAAAFALFLVSQHALTDFLFYYHMASEGRNYEGALHFGAQLRASEQPRLDVFAALAPPAALLISFWYAVDHLRRKIRFSTADWVMGAVAIFVLFYYQKFLARADGHVYHPYTMAVPLLLYIAYRLITAGEAWIARHRWGAALTRTVTRNPLSLSLLVVTALAVPGTLPKLVDLAPGRYRALAANEPWHPLLGYAAPSAVDQGVYTDISTVVRAYLGPNDSIFDFSNEPGLYYYLMANRPPVRYYNVALAMPEDVQQDVVARLKSSRPKLVVFTNDRYGLPSWDYIPSQVRHYEISQYLLDNYHPVLDVQSQLLLVENGANVPSPQTLNPKLTQPPAVNNLYFDAPACDWGYTPNFFSVRPTANGSRAAVSLPVPTVSTGLQPLTLTLPPGSRWTDFQWMEIDTGSHFVDDTFVLSDSPSELRHQVTFKTLLDSPGRYLVRVGNCIQWHGYSGSLELSHGRTQDITAIRLIP
jgi:hypothetical protein